MGLVGESGSGKSVTSLAIMRLVPPQASVSGSIRFRHEELLSAAEEKMRRLLQRNGYVEVKTPLLANEQLFKTSGHWQHYKDDMFIVEDEEAKAAHKENAEFALKRGAHQGGLGLAAEHGTARHQHRQAGEARDLGAIAHALEG